MARVLLINPSMDVEAGFGDYARLVEPMPCVGLAYLAARLLEEGHQVSVLDNFALNLSNAEVVQRIRSQEPDIVGMGVLTPSATGAEELGRLIRESLPGTRVVMGNLHAAIFAEELIRSGACDAVLHGEGERTFPRLVQAMMDEEEPSQIPGVSYKKDGDVVFSGDPELIDDLDALPYPAWDLFPWKKYTFLPFVTVAKPCLSILGTRGCPWACSFCALGYQGRKVRRRSPLSIAKEIGWLVRSFGIRHVGFVDPIFPLDKKHGLATCQAIIEQDIPGRWWWTTETRVDVIDEEMCRAMKRARCRRILFGIESGVDELLSRVAKNTSVEKARRGVAIARAAGLEISAFFMLALPGETAEMTRKTIDFARSLDIDFAKFGITIPYPGTKIYEDLIAQGRLAHGDWRKFSTFNPDPDTLPFVPEGMSGAELAALHKRATWAFYMRPKIIFRQLFIIRSIGVGKLFEGARILLGQLFGGRLSGGS